MKRVNFKKVTIKNFLSIGEEPVIVEFEKGLHIITGNNKDKPERRNAIGKSTIADSVYFAIFGETLREIKKDLIPNNITSGKTHIELEFDVITSSTKTSYTIVRTLSPTKVFLYENGEDKTHDSVANTTKYILDILSASPAIFKNCVIMTVNNAVPFMAKSKIEKRKFIEDIFGLEVFSEMVSQLRAEYNEIKRTYDIHAAALVEINNTYKSYQQQKERVLEKRKEKKSSFQQRKENNITEKQEILHFIDTIQNIDIQSIEQNINTCEAGLLKCDEKITTLTSIIASDKQNIKTLKDAYDKIGTSEDKCPVCLREIKDHDIDYINQEKINLREQIETAALNIKEQNKQLEFVNEKKLNIKNKITKLRNQSNQALLNIQTKQNKIERIQQLDLWLEELEQDLVNVDSLETDFDDVIYETKKRLKESNTSAEQQRNKLSELDVVKYIISEEGVKSYIVNKLLELLNNKLLYYLKKFDSNSICIFNEYFEEEIFNEKNKICSYFNFSGAERKTIDLACLFTFADLRHMQGGVQYNLTIYDELFDSSFDEKGLELVTSILKERVDNLNECTMVISHRKESIKAATGNIIFLEKENGITRRSNYND
jgi:DNA repair exonuclease SbcCD ATPase subunit